MPKKVPNKGHRIIVHPWEVFQIKDLAERLNCSNSTIRNFMNDGLKYKKVKSITMFTGQQVLNYINQESKSYTDEVVKKVQETTGVRL